MTGLVESLPFLLLLVVVGGATLFYTLIKPEIGFLLLALLAPVSNYLRIGSIKLVYVIGVCLLFGVLQRHILKERRPLPGFAIAYGVVSLSCITYAWIIGGFSNSQVAVGLAGSVLIVCAVFVLFDATQIRRWLWLFALGMATADIIVAVLAFAFPSTHSFIFKISSEGVRLRGTLGNPNMFGGAQILAFSIFAFYAVNCTGKIRIANILGVVVIFLALLASQSRSAILGLLLGLGIVGFLKFRLSRRPVYTIATILSVGLAMILTFINLPEEIAGFQLSRIGNTDVVNVYDVGTEDLIRNRLHIYNAALNTISQNPLGIGYLPHDETLKVVARNSRVGVEKTPHNFAISYLLTYGVVGGIVMVLIWVMPAAIIFWRLWSKRIPIDSLASMMLVGLIGYYVHNIFHSATNWIYFWVFWAMCVRIAKLEEIGPILYRHRAKD